MHRRASGRWSAARWADRAVIGLVSLLILAPVVVVFLYAFATKWFPSHWWFPQEFGTRWFERLLGLDLTQDHYDRGRAFVDGVVERAGASGLERLWSSAEVLPTPNEVGAPGLWLARIEFD